MKLTIVREDGTVYKDGLSFSNLDLSAIPVKIHALQFNNATNKGWIEYAEDESGLRQLNEQIESLPNWALIALNKWDEALAEKLAKQQQLTTVGGEQ